MHQSSGMLLAGALPRPHETALDTVLHCGGRRHFKPFNQQQLYFVSQTTPTK